ncbi:hypothetical protein A5893_13950 [Pedobacter psychrophilus]|uniref:Outer membrane protein beta-barrel domain-containing protein n=1 Tax=Pedobacter psychrophilus TaxID=1826909 RepID=A0A179DDH7_9SPHI|nr:hypothetical protein [Pedobacter psychrophilus]OAQ38523.1 hypothetical protein A5893_13950 [Pedobacter psychrophilus]
MKKTTFKGMIAAAALTLITFAGAFAQSSEDGHATRLGVALGIGVPTKSGGADIILAPDLRLQHDLSQRTSLTLTTGYYAPIGGGTNFGDGLIPLKAGAKFFFGDTYYFQPEVGVGFSTVKNGGNPFIYAPSLGYANNKWDIALRYEGFDYSPGSNGMVAVRLAYAFKRPAK